MIHCLVQPRDWLFVRGYRFLSIAKNIERNIGKNINENFNSQYSQKLLDHAKKHATDALKIVSKGHIKKHQKQVMI